MWLVVTPGDPAAWQLVCAGAGAMVLVQVLMYSGKHTCDSAYSCLASARV
eukprot:COSAG01_NODE_24136_length_789_cov_0.959420_1_plen_49_part_10